MTTKKPQSEATPDIDFALASLLVRAGLPKTVSTKSAAATLNRKPQTLRRWASTGTGPIRPVRINGRLAWRTADLLVLVNGGAQ